MMISFKSKLHIAFLFFLISAFYGLLLRINFFLPFKNIMHTWLAQGHSHVAFLGWGFLATITFMNHYFLDENQQRKKVYQILFVLFIVTILGMFISFPLQGYKFFSITFLTLFGIASYLYFYHFLKDLNQNLFNTIAVKFIKWAVYYYLISSVAIWAIGPIAVTLGKTSLYYNGVYFYLHFLYNGFFVFALFGIFLNYFQHNLNVDLSKKTTKFFILTNVACIPAYALSVLWSDVPILLNYIGFLAAFIQVISLFYLIPIVLKIISEHKLIFIQKVIIYTITIAYSLKVFAQLSSAFPEIVQQSIALKSYLIIGYLHLFTLLFMSLFLILLIQMSLKLLQNFGSKLTFYIFLMSVFITEILLFSQGFYIWIFKEIIPNFNWYILLASVLLFSSLCFYYLYQFVFDRIE